MKYLLTVIHKQETYFMANAAEQLELTPTPNLNGTHIMEKLAHWPQCRLDEEDGIYNLGPTIILFSCFNDYFCSDIQWIVCKYEHPYL